MQILLYQFLMIKLSTPPLNFFKHMKKHITLLTYYLLPCPATRAPNTSSQSWGTVGHLARPEQSAVDSAIDGERAFAPAYRPKEDILSSDNMVIEWAVIETVKQCSKFVCFSNRLSIHKLMIKVWQLKYIKNW